MAAINVTINDPQGRLASLPLLVPTIQAALNTLDQYLVFRGTVDITITAETGTGRLTGIGGLQPVGQRDGRDTFESAMASESRSGQDLSPEAADVTFFIDPSAAGVAGLWWDPNIAGSIAANPPDDKVDAYSVILRELLHAMGISGYRDPNTGELPFGSPQTVWDSKVVPSSGKAAFSGANTVALLTTPVEVRVGGAGGATHLGNGPTLAASQQPYLEGSVINGYGLIAGERYLPGRVELAILQDIGWTLDVNPPPDVVNRWDDKVTALYLVGSEEGEQLNGSPFGDRLEGRGGSDLLSGFDGNDAMDGGAGSDSLAGGNGDDAMLGGAGNDIIDGGPGTDTAYYSANLSAYTITSTVTGFIVSGPDGDDTLTTTVELARFADKTGALVDLVPNNVPTGGIAILGTARQGEGLTIVSGLADADGLGSISYRWQSSSDGSQWSDIAGATGAGFTPRDTEVGKQLRVAASYVDGRGHAESVNSGATFAVFGSRVGTAESDTLIGTAFGDIIEGRGGNDTMTGSGGADQIDGGSGTDIAVYALAKAAYRVTNGASGAVVSADSGSEGRDTLAQVERLRFADTSLALDLGGNAGTAARLIGVVFGPAMVADKGAVGIALQFLDAGTAPAELAQLAIDFRLGGNASNADVVRHLYANLTGAQIGSADLAFYTGLMATGALTRGTLTLAAAQTDVEAGLINLAGLTVSGLEYLPLPGG